MSGVEAPALAAPAPARLFVAVWPPPHVLDVLAALPREEQPGVRWLPRPAWHVTLRFLGTADPAAVWAALCALAGPDGPRAAPAALGPRPGRLGRDALVVPVQGLEALAGAVRVATAHLGVPPDPRPFLGHVTIARLRGAPACACTARTVEARWTVQEVALVRSTPGLTGPSYETLATLALP